MKSRANANEKIIRMGAGLMSLLRPEKNLEALLDCHELYTGLN
jgi:hypothetical protein